MTPSGPRSSPSVGPRSSPRAALGDEPALAEARSWLIAFMRALRAWRLYPATSHLRRQHVEAAYTSLRELLVGRGALTLGIREGAFLLGDEEVWLDDDPANGPTFQLATQSIFEISFAEGIPEEELTGLLAILAGDPGHLPRAGEDLDTLLWRRHLKHVRHLHVDVLAAAIQRQEAEEAAVRFEHPETERLRRTLAEMMEGLAVDEASGQDTVALRDGALETPEACRSAVATSQARLERVRAGFELPGNLGALRSEAEKQSAPEALTARLVDLLLAGLRLEPSPLEPNPALATLTQLYRGMIQDHAFQHAVAVVERVRALGDGAAIPRDVALSSGLAARLAEPELIARVLALLETAEDPRLLQGAALFLRALGDEGRAQVLGGFSRAQRSEARELLAEVAVDLTAAHPRELYGAFRGLTGEHGAQLLRTAQRLSPEDYAPLVSLGLIAESGLVRAQALRGLLRYTGGDSEELLARAARDGELEVRGIALRAIGHRRSELAVRRLAPLLDAVDLLERDPADLRLLLVVCASVLQAAALPRLARLFNDHGRLTSGVKAEALEAIASAIAVIDDDEARSLLTKAARSLNPRARGPAKAALESGGRSVLARLGLLAAEPGEDRRQTGKKPPWPEGVPLDGHLVELGAPATAASAGRTGPSSGRVAPLPTSSPESPPLWSPQRGSKSRTAAAPTPPAPPRTGPTTGARTGPSTGTTSGPTTGAKGPGLQRQPERTGERIEMPRLDSLDPLFRDFVSGMEPGKPEARREVGDRGRVGPAAPGPGPEDSPPLLPADALFVVAEGEEGEG